MAPPLWDRLQRIQSAFDSVLTPPILHNALCASLEESLAMVDVPAGQRSKLERELGDLVDRLAVQSIDNALAPCRLDFLESLAEGIHALHSNRRLENWRIRR